MARHKPFIYLWVLLMVAAVGCGSPPLDNDREKQPASLDMTFHSENPDEIQFPVKVLFAIDCSLSMGDIVNGAVMGSDPYDQRFDAVRAFINTYNTSEYENVSFEIMLWNIDVFARTRNGYNQPGFTRDANELNRVLGLAANDSMTDYLGAEDAIRNDIENDMWNVAQEEGGADNLSRTKYIVIFLSDGMPNVQGGTQPNSEIWQRVEDLYDITVDNEVGVFNFHTFLLLGAFPPTAQGASARAQASTTLEGMARRGNGTFREFANADAIDFIHITDMRLTTEYKIKYAVAYNANTIAGTSELHTDSDMDGMPDEHEAAYGTDPTIADTDNDGMSDYFEVKVRHPGNWLDPTLFDSPCQPPPTGTWPDSDSDGLTDCEEYIKGTLRFVADTDRDGIPDGIEFDMGTNPLADESATDTDFDGVSDWLEVQRHTNVTTNDPEVRSLYSYRYDIVDLGLPNPITEPGIPPGVRRYHLNISNIDLRRTAGATENNVPILAPGDNLIHVYIAQVPEDRPASAPVFRHAEVVINFNEADASRSLGPYDFELIN